MLSLQSEKQFVRIQIMVISPNAEVSNTQPTNYCSMTNIGTIFLTQHRNLFLTPDHVFHHRIVEYDMIFQKISLPNKKLKIRNNPILFSFKKSNLNENACEIYDGSFQWPFLVERSLTFENINSFKKTGRILLFHKERKGRFDNLY